MPPRNPSELQRLEEELAYYRTQAYNLRFPKSYREKMLREMRDIEDQLGIDHVSYNGGSK